jgi:hypothetical protein
MATLVCGRGKIFANCRDVGHLQEVGQLALILVAVFGHKIVENLKKKPK